MRAIAEGSLGRNLTDTELVQFHGGVHSEVLGKGCTTPHELLPGPKLEDTIKIHK